jgi:peptidoglycan/LPS O-acetylase OafA/YrhL
MRALAIMLVLAGHCAWIFPPSDGVAMQLLALSGYLGVEVFFVLSGFLIGNILYRMFLEKFTLSSTIIFLKRRWYRTLPNYYLILLVNIGIANYIGYEIAELWRYFLFLQNFAMPMLPFFTESWSLSIEEFAYVLLPLSLLLAASFNNRKVTFFNVVFVLWVVFILNKMYYHSNSEVLSMDQWNLAVKSVVIFRLDAILTGVLCSWLYWNYRRSWNALRRIFLGIGILMLIFLVFGVGILGLFIENYPFFWNVLYLPLTSIMVACFLPVLSTWRSTASALSLPVTFVSKISYSMYLLHYGVVLQLMKFQYHIDGATLTELVFFTAIYFAATIVLSCLLYRFYERPMMDLRDR